MTADPETLAVYDRDADRYVEVTQGAAQDPLLLAFIDALPAGGSVLDLGCGPGLAAYAMAERGFHVTALDASAAMVDRIPAHKRITPWHGSFADVTGEDCYDGIWANFSLLHLPLDEWPETLSRLRRALRPEGLFHVAVKSGEGIRRDKLGRRYTYLTEAALRQLLTEAGFRPNGAVHGEGEGLDGQTATWVALTAHG